MNIKIELMEVEKDLFQQFVKRLGWEDVRRRSATDDEAYKIFAVLEDISEQMDT